MLSHTAKQQKLNISLKFWLNSQGFGSFLFFLHDFFLEIFPKRDEKTKRTFPFPIFFPSLSFRHLFQIRHITKTTFHIFYNVWLLFCCCTCHLVINLFPPPVRFRLRDFEEQKKSLSRNFLKVKIFRKNTSFDELEPKT